MMSVILLSPRNITFRLRVVIACPDWKGEELTAAYIEAGTMINSGQFNGMPNEEGIKAVTDYLEKNGWGKGTISYRMRDWLISRQRYWGAPIPMIYCPKCGSYPYRRKTCRCYCRKKRNSGRPANRR